MIALLARGFDPRRARRDGVLVGALVDLAASSAWNLADLATIRGWPIGMAAADVAWHVGLGAAIGALVGLVATVRLNRPITT